MIVKAWFSLPNLELRQRTLTRSIKPMPFLSDMEPHGAIPHTRTTSTAQSIFQTDDFVFSVTERKPYKVKYFHTNFDSSCNTIIPSLLLLSLLYFIVG